MGWVELKINGGWRDADGPPLDAVAIKVPGGQHLCLARGNNQQHTDKQQRGQNINPNIFEFVFGKKCQPKYICICIRA